MTETIEEQLERLGKLDALLIGERGPHSYLTLLTHITDVSAALVADPTFLDPIRKTYAVEDSDAPLRDLEDCKEIVKRLAEIMYPVDPNKIPF